MNKKKLIVLVASLVMVLTLAIGGTLAYFTDTENKTNVMTIGNIDITLHEIQKIKDTNEDGEPDLKEDFKDEDFVLYPVSNEVGIQYVNKQVDVENTSASADAYIRTIVAFEDWYEGDEDIMGLHHRYFSQFVNAEYYDDVKIDGHQYDVVVFTNVNKEAYKPGEKQYSMGGVWLDENLTQDQVTKYFGEKVEILVLGQGIQATGLTHDQAMAELGAITSDNLSAWFDTEGVAGNVVG